MGMQDFDPWLNKYTEYAPMITRQLVCFCASQPHSNCLGPSLCSELILPRIGELARDRIAANGILLGRKMSTLQRVEGPRFSHLSPERRSKFANRKGWDP